MGRRGTGRTGPAPALLRRWIDLAGVPVHSRETAAAGRRGATPLVLVHGLAVSSAYFVPLLEACADEGIAAIAPDLPGLGHTPHRAGEVVVGTRTVAGMARFVARWLDARGIDGSVPVLGNSLGAQVAVELAASRPDLVAALVLVGPTADPTLPTVRSQIGALLLDATRERASLVVQVAGEVLRTDPRLLRDRARAGMEYATADALAEVSVPAVVLRGDDDPLVSAAWGRALAEVAGVSLVEVAGGHAIHHARPAAVLAASQHLLRDRSGGRPRDP